MNGFYREDVNTALALGWSQDQILSLHNHFVNSCCVTEIYNWGLVDSNSTIWYRGVDVEVAKQRIACNNFSDIATAYTDGSGTTGEKLAGIGVYIEDGPHRIFIAENIGNGTNNYAELHAIWSALKRYPYFNKRILIRSDSEYAIGSLIQPNWRAQANIELIRCIREDLKLRSPNVQFEHVFGHSKIKGNEVADRLASIGRKLL